MKVETRRFSNRRYEKTVLDVTGIRNPGEFAAALTEACSGYGRDTALRITFEGVCAGTVSITETSVRPFRYPAVPSRNRRQDRSYARRGGA